MVSVGDRVRLINTKDPYTNLKSGDEGTVEDISQSPAGLPRGIRIIWVVWDKGNKLGLIEGEDQFSVLRGK